MSLAVPIFKDVLLNLGWFYIPFSMIVIVGSANSVNLTDGLDGLAIMPVMIASGSLGIIAYAVGRVDFSNYLEVHYIAGSGEIAVFSAALIGAGLGFLWYNAPPAKIFMGDGGAYVMGSLIALNTIITNNLNPNISSFFFCTILFYLFFEVFFSLFRNIVSIVLNNNSVFNCFLTVNLLLFLIG